MVINFDFEDDAHFILAVLNSELISNWFIRKFDKFQRKIFPQFKVGELNSFPIPQLSKQKKKEVIKLSKQLQSFYSKGGDTILKEVEDKIEGLLLEAFIENSADYQDAA